MGDGTGTVWRLTGTGRVDYAAPTTDVHWEIEGWHEADPPGEPEGHWYRFMADEDMPRTYGEAEARAYMANLAGAGMRLRLVKVEREAAP